MSERGDIEPCRRFNYAPVWLVVFYTFLLLAFIVGTGLATLGEIRDPQRRVAVLEGRQ
jgi:hypothetical protein